MMMMGSTIEQRIDKLDYKDEEEGDPAPTPHLLFTATSTIASIGSEIEELVSEICISDLICFQLALIHPTLVI
ncbi:hypothetical protein QR98_0054190 [Sarcoptes scabiei]|uniref:Uncharacterized protein n=1 Tax=Sarcoptes scabiei TaxID=52283 RepID=A0A132A7N7_SARSC|nr:hypothetical protein QR98_0054190 [Sarcoptes scabiei]